MRDLKPKSKIDFYLERMQHRGFTADQVLGGTGLRVDRLDDPHGRPKPQIPPMFPKIHRCFS